MVKEPRVSTIILNWNTWRDTVECLDSLKGIDYQSYDLALVDNGSKDESVAMIKDYLARSGWHEEGMSSDQGSTMLAYVTPTEANASSPVASAKRCDLILSPSNRGFTGGNNLAMRHALSGSPPDYILLLNNDTVVKEDFLAQLVEAMERHPECGFASPMILNYVQGRAEASRSSVIQYAGATQSLYFFMPIHRRQGETDDGKEATPSYTGYAHGTCMLVRVAAIQEIGMLDEDFFSYNEENDWAIRGRKRGWRALYVPTSKVWHKGGKSSSQVKGMALYYSARNAILLVRKDADALAKIIFAITFTGFVFPYRVAKLLLLRRDVESARVYIKGVRDGLRWKGTAQ